MGETPAILDHAVDTQTEAPPSRLIAALPTLPLLYRHLSNAFADMPRPRVLWSRATYCAFFALIAVWATLTYATWATWGDLTIDSGHEMYVPAMLSAGKMLYRDVWFMYGPAGPYFNSYLFRVFGLHLNVLYWAGSLAALGSAMFLYLTGMSLGSWVAGWTAGAIVLIQAFGQGLFCFPLPYSFSAVYGCLSACIFLWLVVQAILSGRWVWMLGAGTVGAVALLLKMEFGVACYGTLLLLMVAQSLRQRSWKPIWTGTTAILPGILVCTVVALWMVSIAGPDFITQENFMSWPTSYFMKAYGKMWLERTGFTLSKDALLAALGRISIFAGIAMGLHLPLRRKRAEGGLLFLCLGLAVAVLECLSLLLTPNGAAFLRWIVFPKDMVLIVGLAAAACWWVCYRRGFSDGTLTIGILLTFPALLAFRMLMGMESWGYPIYYNGTVILAFLFLGSRLIVPDPGRSRTFEFRAELVVCCCCLSWVVTHTDVFVGQHTDLAPLITERGVIKTQKHMVVNYQKAIAFMKERAAAGDSVLSIPEDTSLYFLSGTICPTRVYQFTPGVLAPGKMTEDVIGEIERKKVRYLLWSNRTSAEYGVPVFGRFYDTYFGDYLTSHYCPVGPVYKNTERGWNAVVWERMPEEDKSQ